MRKNFSLNISLKLAIGFGIALLAVLSSYIVIYQMLKTNKEISIYLGKNIVPTVSNLNTLEVTILESKYLTKSWVEDRFDNTLKKKQLIFITDSIYPDLRDSLTRLSSNWAEEQINSLNSILSNADELILREKEIMKNLNSWEKYDDPYFENKYSPLVLEGNELMSLADSVLISTKRLSSIKKDELLDNNKKLDISFGKFSSRIIISGLILSVMIILVGFILAQSLLVPINYLKRIVLQMGSGELPDKKIKIGSDETGKMGAALNELIKGLREKAAFAGSIGKNVFDSDFKPLSSKDILGNSLLRMRDSLVQASEEAEIRRIENYERSWASQGIAEFNEIIREHNDSIEDFTSVIISKLTKYLDAQLGGLYILNDENPKDTFLELSAFYAYDRQKFISKQIKPGENLVGQSLIEEDTIFITDIPENYVNITSGLGKDTPKSLLIVPLKLNEKIHGVVELASFNVFKPYQIEFVEKTGEILASTIANININIKTSKLLGESNEKSERLALQEAESHRNLEKLQRTLNEKTEKENQLNLRLQKIDEEFKSQIKRLENRLEQTNKLFEQQTLESKSYLEILNHSLLVVEVNQNGEILNANKKFLKTSGVLMVDITGTSIYDYYAPAHESSSDYIELKKNMFEGKPFTLSTTYIFDNKEIYLYETHTPLRNSKGDIYKIIITSALENN